VVTFWPAPGGLHASDQIALDALAGTWADAYDVFHADGTFFAYRLFTGPLLDAGTLGGLESSIRADFARRAAQADGESG
jgi:hypothetical protein